jgi:PTH1 family peptidyl-tRNA hydrolase
MKLIVGLGNPGAKYAQTRHNLGFLVLDHIAEHFDQKFTNEPKFTSHLLKLDVQGETLILTKPQTMMNLSGQAVRQLAQFYKVTTSDIWVIQDDIDLDFGKLRIRQGGSSGGHNGLKSIIEYIGEEFVRFKIGVANPQLRHHIDPEDFVLQRFTPDESQQIGVIIGQTAKQVARHLMDAQIEDHTLNLLLQN